MAGFWVGSGEPDCGKKAAHRSSRLIDVGDQLLLITINTMARKMG
jgi:hypothetical protein